MMLSNRSLLLIYGLVLSLLLGVSANAFAELTLIYDNGQTRPLAPLLEPLLADDSPSSGPAESATLNPSSRPLSSDGPADLRNLLPVHSPGLTVGDIAGSALHPEVLARLAQGNPRPFFLIGSDATSLRWLASHRDVLEDLGAVGMLIQAETETDVRRVAEVAEGLSITLGSGSDLAAALGIDRYPVLITTDGIRQ
jgi:integrating conjugative element protein (TIGR03765 family)